MFEAKPGLHSKTLSKTRKGVGGKERRKKGGRARRRKKWDLNLRLSAS
jgi:hypothetical protein